METIEAICVRDKNVMLYIDAECAETDLGAIVIEERGDCLGKGVWRGHGGWKVAEDHAAATLIELTRIE